MLLLGLVIFHCSFLSLRTHDGVRHVDNGLDHVLKGETSNFAGYDVCGVQDSDKLADHLGSAIRDSGFKHALRLYRDKSTGAIRLEASVLDGDMKQ